MFSLEKYGGLATRYTCPACGRKKKLSRYIDTETGQYIAEQVGRCDRETSCGYHLKPKEYFADNPSFQNANFISKYFGTKQPAKNLAKPNIADGMNAGSNRGITFDINREDHLPLKKPDYIDRHHLIDSLDSKRFKDNGFVQFLLGLFPIDPDIIWQAVNDYMIGSTEEGKTIFWQVDQNFRIRTGKIIQYDSETGRRSKELNPNWIHAVLKKTGKIEQDFELQQCFFGEHLLRAPSTLPIAIVESEKSAIIASICKAVFPDMIWLASGSFGWLNVERLERFGRNRKIILYPDADKTGKCMTKWREIASDARKSGLMVIVSDLLEKHATDEEKANGYDLADYLIREQRLLNDPVSREQFNIIVEERMAIMTINGRLSEKEAKAFILTSGLYKQAESLGRPNHGNKEESSVGVLMGSLQRIA